MTSGLVLSKKYFEEIGKPIIQSAFPDLYKRMAFGLVGEGSECLGFDDGISMDHDWGPGFCIWLELEDFLVCGEALKELYSSLPKEYMGYRRSETAQGRERVGVQCISEFYTKYIGTPCAPTTLLEWFRIPEQALCIATNGRVFFDGRGKFSAVRKKLLAYYPEDIRLKKLAARCATMAQAGQYNFLRCVLRKDGVAAHQAKNEFIVSAISAIHLLNKKYMPFYKWAWRSLGGLGILGDLAKKLEDLANIEIFATQNEILIEQICARVIEELVLQDLSNEGEGFLIPHAEAIMGRIQDEKIGLLHIMQG